MKDTGLQVAYEPDRDTPILAEFVSKEHDWLCNKNAGFSK